MSRSNQPKKRLMRAVVRICIIISAFLPAIIYSVFVHLSLIRGEPYDSLEQGLMANDASEYYLTMQVIGSVLGIICTIALGIFYVLRFKKIEETKGALDKSILIFAITMQILQLAHIIYFTIFQANRPIFAYNMITSTLTWRILSVIVTALRRLCIALAVSGLYFIVWCCSSSRRRLAGWLEIFKQILVVSIPILICVFTHIIATAKGLPYNQSCCAIFLPDPDGGTVTWFLVWEISGAVLAFMSSFILLIGKLKSHARNKGTAKAIIDLLCVNILIGEMIVLTCYALIVCHPGMANDGYRARYFNELLGRNELPFYYVRWNECVAYALFVLPVATIISSARAAMLIHKKNRHSNP